MFVRILARLALAVSLTAALLELGAWFAIPAWPAWLAEPSRWFLLADPHYPLGYRDAPRSFASRGRPRILVVGDSFAEVPRERPVTAILQELLPDREIVNLGKSGDDPRGYYHRYRVLGRRFEGVERVVVLVYESNDFGLPCRPDPDLPPLAIWPELSLASRILPHAERLYYAIRHRLEEGHTERRTLTAFAAAWKGERDPGRRLALFASAYAALNGIPLSRVSGALEGISREHMGFFLGASWLNLRGGYVAGAVERVLGGRIAPVKGPDACQFDRSAGYLAAIRRLAPGRVLAAFAPEGHRVDPILRAHVDGIFGADMRERFCLPEGDRERFFSALRREGMPLLDLTGALSRAGLYQPDGHWNAAGVEAAARELAKRLRQ